MRFPAVPVGMKRCGACARALNEQGVCPDCHPELAALKAPPPRSSRACAKCGRPSHRGHCRGYRNTVDRVAAAAKSTAWQSARAAERAVERATTRGEAADARPVVLRDDAPCRAGGDAPRAARQRGPWMGAGEWLGAD